jgi:hypothetical protein
LYFIEFGCFHDFENIFNLVDEHDFFWTVDFWPVLEESADNLLVNVCYVGWREGYLLCESWIFFEKLNYAIC